MRKSLSKNEIRKKAGSLRNARILWIKLRKFFGDIAKQAALCGKDRQLMRAGNNQHLSRKKLKSNC